MKKAFLILLVPLFILITCTNLVLGADTYTIHKEDLSGFVVETGEDAIPLTLGTRFAVKVPGTITKVRMYVGAEESGSYTVEIWDTAAEELVAGPYFWDLEKGQAGWREYELEEPLQVKAYNDYTVAIRNTTGSLSYQYIKGYYQDHESDIFITHPDSGVYQGDEGAMPVGTNRISYPSFLRDVVFIPGEGKEAPKQKSEMADKSTVYLSDLLLGNMYSNGTIVFVDGTDEAKGYVINSKEYKKGLMHVASSKEGESFIEINIEGLGFKTFACYAGVPDLLFHDASNGSVEFIVSVDGVEVARSEVKRSQEEASLLTADIEGGKILRLYLSDAGDGTIGDFAVWGNAILTKNDDIEKAFEEVVDLSPTEEPTSEPTENPEETPSTTSTPTAEPDKKDEKDNIPKPLIIAGVIVVAVIAVIVVIRIKKK
ncbi:MAG: NPCBM/NEW2 domain-containing protein [Clostridia bacterium]|jgi:hypothetical protein|nr:DUF4082 domain-containing protein [Clostridiaceae bacterium]